MKFLILFFMVVASTPGFAKDNTIYSPAIIAEIQRCVEAGTLSMTEDGAYGHKGLEVKCQGDDAKVLFHLLDITAKRGKNGRLDQISIKSFGLGLGDRLSKCFSGLAADGVTPYYRCKIGLSIEMDLIAE